MGDENEKKGLPVNEEGKIVLKIDGEERALTTEELASEIAKVQKSQSAEKRFQEAAKLRETATKTLEEARRTALTEMAELTERAELGDEAAFVEVLKIRGTPEAEVQQRLVRYREILEESRGQKKGAGDVDKTAQKRKLELDELPDEVRKIVEQLNDPRVVKAIQYAGEQRTEAGRRSLHAEIREALDKTGTLGRYLKNEKAAEKVVATAERLVKDRVRDGADYSPTLLREVAEEVDSFVGSLREVEGDPAPLLGLGIAPAGGYSETQSKEPPKPSRITDSGYDRNVTTRLAHFIRE